MPFCRHRRRGRVQRGFRSASPGAVVPATNSADPTTRAVLAVMPAAVVWRACLPESRIEAAQLSPRRAANRALPRIRLSPAATVCSLETALSDGGPRDSEPYQSEGPIAVDDVNRLRRIVLAPFGV